PSRLRRLAARTGPRPRGRSRHARRAPRRSWRVPRCQALARARSSPPLQGTQESKGNETVKGAKRPEKGLSSQSDGRVSIPPGQRLHHRSQGQPRSNRERPSDAITVSGPAQSTLYSQPNPLLLSSRSIRIGTV